MIKIKIWLWYALITTVAWGIWGALIELPEKAGFPATLGYVAWALTMIPFAVAALYIKKWHLDTSGRAILLGSLVGLFGAGGQLILFQALRDGPAYVVFPLISLFPVVTIFLSTIFLKEKANKRQWAGISMALIAIFLLSYQPTAEKSSYGQLWLLLSIFVFILWGFQAFIMKFSNEVMSAESIFFYMMAASVVLIPVAIWMTNFNEPINWGFKGAYLAGIIHTLNALGALTLVYALRYGKAIIVVPLTGLSPIITIILSLVLYSVIPGITLSIGMILAMVAIVILSE
ncbi:MAG: DMT family transporter [Candidatus Cyclobacteriaceae bacterium M2_1C_046]